MNADEFMRRWEAMPDLKYAELIDGIVHMSSPLSDKHSAHNFPLSGWLLVYAAATPGCRGGSEGTWLMTDDSVPQPDIALRLIPEYGGQSRMKGDYPLGAPEMIVEVAVSSYSRDLGAKLKLYERAAVREYLVALPSQKKVIWHEQTDKGFQAIPTDVDGIYRSRCFPGLWLDPSPLWRFDYPGILAVLQQGIASPEHSEFVSRLAKVAASNTP